MKITSKTQEIEELQKRMTGGIERRVKRVVMGTVVKILIETVRKKRIREVEKMMTE